VPARHPPVGKKANLAFAVAAVVAELRAVAGGVQPVFKHVVGVGAVVAKGAAALLRGGKGHRWRGGWVRQRAGTLAGAADRANLLGPASIPAAPKPRPQPLAALEGSSKQPSHQAGTPCCLPSSYWGRRCRCSCAPAGRGAAPSPGDAQTGTPSSRAQSAWSRGAPAGWTGGGERGETECSRHQRRRYPK
jgi:hypothetical protein